jgi:transglutaminase-like putative cysteine protease
MLYDVSMRIGYSYEVMASGARQVIRVLPLTVEGSQRLIAGTVSFSPPPDERADFSDFFHNQATAINFRNPLDKFDIRMQARVLVESPAPRVDVTPRVSKLADEIFDCWTLGPEAPHHFLGDSPMLGPSSEVAEWGRSMIRPEMSVMAAATTICDRIYRQFTYLPGSTRVDTPASTAFKLKKGVCQDFTHIMILALRAMGIPAGYVSGFLRTIPPPGKERLEGADAMHAWVRVWCGKATGWLEWDPTNNMMAGADHIRVGYGRDYSDVAPVVGILKSYGSHKTEQAVDVVPVKS